MTAASLPARRVFLVHPNAAALAPMADAARRLWPEAAVFNVLEEALYAELDAFGTITAHLVERLTLLFRYCAAARADGIIFTGSTFGPAVEAARRQIAVPVLKSDEAMTEDAVRRGGRIAVLGTARRSLAVIAGNLEAEAGRTGRAVTIARHFVPEAQAALQGGDRARHDRLVAAAAAGVRDCEVLVIGQMSMVPAAAKMAQVAGRRILTAPEAAIVKLRSLLLADQPSDEAGAPTSP